MSLQSTEKISLATFDIHLYNCYVVKGYGTGTHPIAKESQRQIVVTPDGTDILLDPTRAGELKVGYQSWWVTPKVLAPRE